MKALLGKTCQMSYSVTVDWSPDSLYGYLDSLRNTHGSFETPIHISILSFLKVSDENLPSFREFMRQLSSRRCAHSLEFSKMKYEPFADTPGGELEKIWEELYVHCLGYKFASSRMNSRHFEPHVTIADGKSSLLSVHEDVRRSQKH
ncbi:hypothetical protein C8R43DRAFT_1111361 [Mycena crocata]|nr:hypothetical protein C8R43DRAFT_1111361 [Mycena crocata]